MTTKASSSVIQIPGSNTQILYNSSGAFGTSSNFTFNGSTVYLDGTLGLGVSNSSPGAKLSIKDDANAGYEYLQYNSSDGCNLRNYRARGTIAAPTQVLAGDRLVGLTAAGYHSGGAFSGVMAAINIIASENFTATAQGTAITLATSLNGTTTAQTERLRIDNAGRLGLNVTPNGSWTTAGTVLQFGNLGALNCFNIDDSVQMTRNGYYDGTAWKFLSSAHALNYYQLGQSHVWRITTDTTPTANAALTWRTAMQQTPTLWQTNITANGGWNTLTFQAGQVSGMTSGAGWGDANAYGTLGVGDSGVMINNPHIVWNVANGFAGFRCGRAGGVSSGNWWQAGTNSSGNFSIGSQAATNGFIIDTSYNVNIPSSGGFYSYRPMNMSGTDGGALTCRASGTGDAAMAGITFWNDSYAIHAGIRNDGYFGIGGWSRAAWSWYTDPSGNMVAGGNVTAYSDPRLKDNVKRIDNHFDILFSIEGVTFDWNERSRLIKAKWGKHDYGILADQVKAVMPEIVTASINDEENGEIYDTVDYSRIVPVLIEAIKELKLEIDKLKEV